MSLMQYHLIKKTNKQIVKIRGLSGKYPAILNISRTGSVALI